MATKRVKLTPPQRDYAKRLREFYSAKSKQDSVFFWEFRWKEELFLERLALERRMGEKGDHAIYLAARYVWNDYIGTLVERLREQARGISGSSPLQ